MIQLAIALGIVIFKLIKCILIKTRLYIVAVPAGIVLIFFMDWYDVNTLLADVIGIALLVGVVVSWIITLVKHIRSRKKNQGLVIDWSYERYGKPKVLTKETL